MGSIVLRGDDATEAATVNGVKLEHEAQGGREPMPRAVTEAIARFVAKQPLR